MSIGSVLVATSNDKVKYDKTCKQLMANRQLLARLLKGFVPEFRDCPLEAIENEYIEPESIRADAVPVERNLSNIEGLNTEDATANEGTVRYDVLFNAISPEEGGRIIVGLRMNVELQNDYYPGYPLEKRALYYCARNLSSQFGTITEQTDYGKLVKVYSIWLCIGDNIPITDANTATMYSMHEECLVGGTRKKREDYDLMTAIIIRATNKAGTDNRTIKLFANLFDSSMGYREKIEYLEDEGISVRDIAKEVKAVCNLSYAIEQKGRAEGLAEGRISERNSIILRMHNLRVEEIMEYADETRDNVIKVLKDNGYTPVF